MNGTRPGGLPTPRAQFINNGFGLGEFLGKRGLTVLALSSECAVKRQRMAANILGFDKGTLEVPQGSRRQTLGASRFPLSKPHTFYVLQWKPTLHKPSS